MQGGLGALSFIASGYSLYGEGLGIGASLGDGIAAGIAGTVSAVAAAAAQVVFGAVRAAKFAGAIASPSKLFAREVGAPIAQGVAVGILGERGTVNASLSSLIDGLTSPSVSASRLMGSMPTGPGVAGGGASTVVQVFALKSDELTALMRQAESGHGAALYVDGLERAFAGVMGG